MTVSKEVYQDRKENNLCTKCGKIAEYNKTLCLYHLRKASRNQKAMYARRREKGQCPFCSQIIQNNRKICNKCLEKQVQKHRDDVWIPYKNRKQLGLCLDCGKTKSTKNLYCNKCYKKRGISKSLIYKQRTSQGLCGHCGKGLRAINRKRCVICIYKHKKWYETSDFRLRMIKEGQSFKNRVIQYYGNKCNCCNETEKTFLAIDHINGNGNAHRKSIKKYSSYNFYQWLIDQNFPKEFQILCHNCNMSKYLLGGICAHKRE